MSDGRYLGSNIWDPKLIISQIVLMQCLFYIGLGVLVAILDFMFGQQVVFGQLFDAQKIKMSSVNGWTTILAFFVNAFVCAGWLLIVVERAKKCLDFAATAHILHMMACWLHTSFPGNWEWWIVNILCLIATTVLAEKLCMNRETLEIPRRGGRGGYIKPGESYV